MSRSSLVSLAVGLLVAASLIAANDPTAILRTLLQAGWGVAAVVALHLPQILLSALGWRALIADPARPGIATLAHLRWVRESVNNLLPVARVGGEIVRGRMLVRRGVAGVTTAASLAVDLAVETATLVVFALLGLIALALLPNAGGPAAWIAGAATAIGGVAAIAFMLAQSGGLFRLTDRVMPWLARRTGWQAAADGGATLHDAVVAIYRTPHRLRRSGAAHLGSWLVGTLEIWVALQALGIEAGLAEALVIESLGQVVRSMGFLVPGALGVQEGGYVLVCGLFGIPPEGALALSLVRRLRDLLLGLPGLAAWRWEAARAGRAAA